ncbi:hypothetical protein C7S13_3047 [Burkholderia cepacia]|nr:hypothetical protein [Burkholderia cepacia]
MTQLLAAGWGWCSRRTPRCVVNLLPNGLRLADIPSMGSNEKNEGDY